MNMLARCTEPRGSIVSPLFSSKSNQSDHAKTAMIFFLCYRWLLLVCVIGRYFCSYFSSIFDPTSLHIPYPTFLPHVYLSYIYPFMSFTLTNRQQEHNSIGTTGHRTTRLLGYRHSETVLLWFPFTRILHWNLLCCHRTLPPLKVPDFPDMEHE